ncbi:MULTISPECIES: hypothetical protein [unclassified Wolbachia]|uniref:hypothetical protein n=1 Tax=unclassified Wolbachia TaxID=2640676 RepID=UPI0022326505|nr:MULTISPECIES: hypothetical protein [unclassified Wolbachia]
MVTDTKDPFKDYFDFLGFRKLSDQPSRILSSIRKYSGTISIASTIATLIAFTAFSIQPVIVALPRWYELGIAWLEAREDNHFSEWIGSIQNI